MTIFNVVIFFMCFGGLLMIVGGLFFLYKGIIKLNEASQEEAISIQYKEAIKVQTHYPALAFFIIGIGLLISAAFFSKGTDQQLTVRGQLAFPPEVKPDSVSVMIDHNWKMPVQVFHDGVIEQSLSTLQDSYRMTISLPGHQVEYYLIDPKKSTLGVITIGSINVGPKSSEMPSLNPNNIIIPSETLPPASAKPAFGQGENL